jgi:hypothetical protein
MGCNRDRRGSRDKDIAFMTDKTGIRLEISSWSWSASQGVQHDDQQHLEGIRISAAQHASLLASRLQQGRGEACVDD